MKKINFKKFPKCPECEGTGEVLNDSWNAELDGELDVYRKCPMCNGYGAFGLGSQIIKAMLKKEKKKLKKEKKKVANS